MKLPTSFFKRFLLLLATALLAGVPGCKKNEEPRPDVIVLHSGRLRGNIYPAALQSISPLQHYQYIAGYVRSVREEAARIGARVLLVDLGDSLDGSFAAHVTGSQNVAEFFNAIGYDAVLLGNLDANVSAQTLSALKMPVLTPFADAQGAPVPPSASPSALLPLAPEKSALLLANFYGDVSPGEFPDRFPKVFGEDSVGVFPIREYPGILKDTEGAGVTLFAWQKFEAPTNPPEEFLAKLRELGVDAILAQRVYGRGVKDVWSEETFPGWRPPVSQNILRDNRGFTIARMDLKKNAEGAWEVLSSRLVPMTANEAPADAEILRVMEQFAPVIEKADLPLAKLEAPVDEQQILTAFLSALTLVPEATAVAYSPQSVRGGLPAGGLRASQLFNILPWTTPIVQIPVTPAMLETLHRKNPGIEFWKFVPATPAVDPLDLSQQPAPAVATDAATDALPVPATAPVEQADALIPAEPPPFLLTTSKYFARIFSDQLGLPLNAAKVAGPSEFDHFADSIRNNPSLLTAQSPPPGWEPPGSSSAPASNPATP